METRKPLRLEGFDYAAHGAYFVTICTEGRRPLFWSSRCNDRENKPVGANCVRPPTLPLSDMGRIVDAEIRRIPTIYPGIRVEPYVIMPNHIHMVVIIETNEHGRTQFAPTLSRIIKQFKGAITKQIGRPIWQRSFYDHVIRSEAEYLEVWTYIQGNPLTWSKDPLYAP